MKSVWTTASTKEKKPWGREIVWSTNAGTITGKILHLNKGHRTSLKFNNVKNETLFVLQGVIVATYSDEDFEKHNQFQSKKLKPGDCLNVQSCCPYRLKAIEDAVIVEIGDRVSGGVKRFHDDYGRELSTGTQNIIKASNASSRSTEKEDT